MREISFYEKQRMSAWILILPTVLATGMAILFSDGDIRVTLPVLIAVVILAAAFIFITMQTVIDENGLYVKMFPFLWKYRFFAWADIEKAYIRQYKPLIEYGGWGCRSNEVKIKGVRLFRTSSVSNIAYNMQGNIGLQLIFKDGNKVLIGTCHPEEMDSVLQILIDRGKLPPFDEE